MAVVTLAGTLLIPLAIGGGAARWGLRYQLPFFVSWAPIFGFTVGRWLRARASLWVGVGLLLVSLPYLLLNNTRPLIGMQPWPTRTRSVLTAPASELAFAILAGSKDPGKADALGDGRSHQGPAMLAGWVHVIEARAAIVKLIMIDRAR